MGGGLWNLEGTPLELLKSSHICPWLVREERQGGHRPNPGEGSGEGWRRGDQRALGAQGAPAGGLGKGRG
jgi:hypothetical protein